MNRQLQSQLGTRSIEELAEAATCIRAMSCDIVEAAGSGHLGLSLGMAEVFAVLFCEFLKHDPADPKWPDRDRFVLSAGHGTPAYYSALHLSGYPISLDDLRSFRKLGSKTPGHPEFGVTPGVEATTGALGQGLGVALGFGLAERLLNARFGDQLVNHKTYCLVGDGCLMEGISHEVASLAGHLGLGQLTVLWDDNRITIDGYTDLTTSDDQAARFASCGWRVLACDGHDIASIRAALHAAQSDIGRPTLIACRTTAGYGIADRMGTPAAHGGAIGAERATALRDFIGWDHKPFVAPESVKATFDPALGRIARENWSKSLDASGDASTKSFQAAVTGAVPLEAAELLATIKRRYISEQPEMATRAPSLEVIAALEAPMPWIVAGAADVTLSTFTKPAGRRAVRKGDFTGKHVHYGVREHAMAACAVGMAVHGGIRPVIGTFLPFLEYARPALRTAAMMRAGIVCLCSHDSIGGGDDGPTHQAVEQIAGLRATPGLHLFRPADCVEAVECWEVALSMTDEPVVMSFSAQGRPATDDGLPTLRSHYSAANMCAMGAYTIREADGPRHLTVLATGSEVALALQAAESVGPGVAVVSMPCWSLFERQPATYRESVLGTAPRLAVEAASAFGWTRYVDSEADVLAVDGFGHSARWKESYLHFGLTVENLSSRMRQIIARQKET